MPDLKTAVLKLVRAQPKFARALVHEIKVARLTTPPITMKYYDMGDFGGTHRITNSWNLEVGGSTFRIKDALTRAGLKWNPKTKTWGLQAILYAMGQMGKPAALYNSLRKKQEAAHKMLKPIIEAENKLIEAENKAVVGEKPERSMREFFQMIRQNERIKDSLKDKYGIDMSYDLLDRYSPAGAEPQLVLKGNTFHIKGVLQQFGFRWEGARKAWKLPLMEYDVVKGKLIPALMRALSKYSKTVTTKVLATQDRQAYWPEDRAYHPRRRQPKPKYPGFLGSPEAQKAIAKGYLNLGLGDPKLVNSRAAYAVADWVGMQLLKTDKAFLLDPEGIFKKLFGSEAKAAEAFKGAAIDAPAEQISYAHESEDHDEVAKLHKFIEQLEKKRVQVKAVVGKLGRGYKITW